MIYGIALCTYYSDGDYGMYGWELLDGLVFRSRSDALEHADKHMDHEGWIGEVTFEDEHSWNWRRDGNVGEMDDLCLIQGDSRACVVKQIRNLG